MKWWTKASCRLLDKMTGAVAAKVKCFCESRRHQAKNEPCLFVHRYQERQIRSGAVIDCMLTHWVKHREQIEKKKKKLPCDNGSLHPLKPGEKC